MLNTQTLSEFNGKIACGNEKYFENIMKTERELN